MIKFYDVIKQKFPNYQDDDKDLDYVVAGNFASFIKTNLNNSDVKDYFDFIEELIENKEFEDVVSLGLLESMQNTYDYNERQLVKSYLLPKSIKIWNELNRFWGDDK